MKRKIIFLEQTIEYQNDVYNIDCPMLLVQSQFRCTIAFCIVYNIRVYFSSTKYNQEIFKRFLLGNPIYFLDQFFWIDLVLLNYTCVNI